MDRLNKIKQSSDPDLTPAGVFSLFEGKFPLTKRKQENVPEKVETDKKQVKRLVGG